MTGIQARLLSLRVLRPNTFARGVIVESLLKDLSLSSKYNPNCIENPSLFSEIVLDWKTAIIRPVFKEGDKFDASKYRPVILSSLVVKVMESIIYDHMIAFLVTHQLIPREQHEFLSGRSVQSNLLCCMSDWTKDADSERPLDVV
ncbi:uncharacterized protein LOC135138679 [Zophobas morio]|uniref:uncharacterized protein LOC135138679 n=1 Tax=Zophobas morio TaxID=2755281 RepID=UPI003082DAAE